METKKTENTQDKLPDAEFAEFMEVMNKRRPYELRDFDKIEFLFHFQRNK